MTILHRVHARYSMVFAEQMNEWMPGTILGSGHSAVKKKKTYKNPHFYGDYIVVREKKEP